MMDSLVEQEVRLCARMSQSSSNKRAHSEHSESSSSVSLDSDEDFEVGEAAVGEGEQGGKSAVASEAKTTINMESFVNRPIPMSAWSSYVENEEAYRCSPFRLNLLNLGEQFDWESCIPSIWRNASEPQEILCRERHEVSLLFDLYDEETRVDERHPLAALQVCLLREWGMLHLLDVRDVDRTFTS